jgi:hypothetical protein
MKIKLFFLVYFLLFIPRISITQSVFSLSGYYKNYFAAIDLPKYRSSDSPVVLNEPPLGWVNNRLRLQLSYHINSNISSTAAYDFAPRIQDPALFEQQLIILPVDPLSYRFTDIPKQLYPSEGEDVSSFVIFQNLDRFYFSIRLSTMDFFIGRQAIAWGTARAINPTDIIAPFAFYELDTEDRIGIDAIRLRIPLGFMGELDSGYIFGENFEFEKSAYYIRSKFYAMMTDFTVLLLGFRTNFLVGFDIARSIGGAGFWFETAYVFVDVFSNHSVREEDNYWRLSTGMDYSINEKTYGFIEFHFNGAGSTNPADYLTNYSKKAYTEGSVYLTGKYYIAPGIIYQITPLLSINGISFFNITDPSLYLAPQFEYNISENIYLSGGIYLGIGKKPEFRYTSTDTLDLRYLSEFGSYPNLFFTSFRIYF